MNVRVRFAPSPTGYMHIGNVRTALFNWLFARQKNGLFILRIEDTDLQRNVEDAVDVITEGLSWIGMDWDEGPEVGGDYGPYFQSQRLDLYHEHAQILLQNDRAYVCTCSPDKEETDCRCRDKMDEDKQISEGNAVKFVNPGGTTEFADIVQDELSFENEQFGDYILIKSDETPTYNFANVVDDHAMDITHVIRGDDHVSNTPRQLMLYEAFDFEPPKFAHLPQILADDGARMSKRHGAASLNELRDRGFLPQATMNYLALLGWAPEGEREFLDTEQLIQEFQLDRVNKSPAQFNMKRLIHLNSLHMEETPLEERAKLAANILKDQSLIDAENLDSPEVMKKISAIVEALGTRFKYGEHILDYGAHFFSDEYLEIDEDLYSYLSEPSVRAALRDSASKFEQLAQWTIDNIEQVIRDTADAHDLKAAPLIHALRVSLSGKTVGPGLFTLVHLVGQDECARRIESALEQVEQKTN